MKQSDMPHVRKFYRNFRDHQLKVMANGGSSITTYASGRVEISYAAPYGEHALCAWMAAKRHVNFLHRIGVLH